MYRKSSRKLRENVSENKRKNCVSLIVFHAINTKIIEEFLVNK